MASGLRFKGSITVAVDPSRLLARLVLSRDGELEYDEGALTRILSDAGVVQGYDLDELVGAIQAFQKTKGTTLEVEAARGQPPVPPTGETWLWEDLPVISEDLKVLALRAFKEAGSPQIEQVRVEKVKVQKRIATKGGLFKSDHEEIQTVIETREIRQKVLVDPNPLKVFWVESGTKLATLSVPKPGQPGTDLSGKPVAVPTTLVSSFYAGTNLNKQKTEVLAAETGFLRVGRNWADLVPHRDHRWGLTYSPDKTSAFLTFEPGNELAGPFSADEVVSRLNADGFTSSQVLPVFEIQALIDEARHRGENLLAHPLVSDRDGTFEVHFSEDRTKAFLDLFKPMGRGAHFSLKDLGTRLREAKLQGFSFEAIKDVIEGFLNGPETELRNMLLCSSKEPVRGKDLVLTYSVGFLPPENLAALKSSMAANPRSLQMLPDRLKLPLENVLQAAPVHANQEFAYWETPESGAGEPGVDVAGAPIPAPRGLEPPITLLANVRRNGDKLEAVIDGLMEVGVIEGVTLIRVRPHVDAVATVTRSDDNLLAWLTLVQGRGSGRKLDRALIDAALSTAQIRNGIDEAQIKHALETAQVSGKIENCLVAQGTPAANDFARRLTFSQASTQEAGGKRKGTIRAGEVAATYRPPTENEIDGLDVLGNPIPSSDMELHSLVVSPDFEVETDPQGLQVLKALKSGEVVFDGEALSIVSSVTVNSVGGKAGNVKFPGEVVVAGAIETGGYVVAGNLKVRGRVGGALLSSDHNIQVADGIHGEGKAVLRAKKHISVGFVERALVMAVGDVHIGKAALGVTFRVNGKIFQKTVGGGIQGGLAKVRLGLDVMNLGSPSGVPTVVSFGQDYLVEDQIQAEVKETDKLREAIVQLDGLMRKLTAPEDREKLNGARQKKVLMMKLLDKRNLKLIFLRDKFDLHVASEIVIRETLFPGVSIESHGRLYEPQSRRKAVRIVFNEQTGHIQELPLA